ncbi:homoserine dehydrogenase-like protein [Novymonas esmeraldas]|uniref:Homoserine dehydrogenase n=1 Tax=Novymonas esmeraldas TaxID=1808958 RepID=A0AAW0EM55_9TRYP
MTIVRAAILGFGTVGQGVYNIVQQRREALKERLGGAELVVVKVLVRDLHRPNRVLPEHLEHPEDLLTDDIDEVFRAGVHVVFEATVGEEPAFTYLRRAVVEHGCSVITANKVMFARYGAVLQELAAACVPTPAASPATRLYVGFEATVAAGVPIIKTLQNMCYVQDVRRIEGIVNGTSNYVLTELREHPEKTFDAVVRQAQELGYAEADPTSDVSGQDAFMKLLVMIGIAFGRQPDRATIPVTGIDTLTPEMLSDARAKGLRYRHVVSAAVESGASPAGLTCAVGPMLLGPEHPLYHMDGTTSAVTVWTGYLDAITISGPGAGMYPTASAMLEDYAVWMAAFGRSRAAPA